MMTNSITIYKSWVPKWMIRLAIFMVLLPSMGLFGLSTANMSAAVGYYGIEPADVQYSMIIFYAAVASFFALERRFFNYVVARHYLILVSVIQICTSYICYTTHSLGILFLFRFVQGMANSAITSICITLIFRQIHNERAREIGYSVFYGMLLCIGPFTTLITAPVLDAFDFNVLYKAIIFTSVPGTVFLFIIMNSIRLNKKFPLYQLDWASFIIYATGLCLLGYVLIYGQQYYWFQDKRIILATAALVFIFALHLLRQIKLKRPYLDQSVFRYRNYVIGAVLVFVLYICRGAMSVTSAYFATVLGMDPIHIGQLMIYNMVGILISVIISSRLITLKKPMRLIWMTGFLFLLTYHVWMSFLFDTQADANTFIMPLMIQGLGAGMLMTPIIVFMISSVPAPISNSASAIGVFFRFTGFSGSMALINYFQLSGQLFHLNRFQQSLSVIDPAVATRLDGYKQFLINRGMTSEQAVRLSNGLFSKSITLQAQLRAYMDYYHIISWIILAVILLIALYPYFNRTSINLRHNQPSPATY